LRFYPEKYHKDGWASNKETRNYQWHWLERVPKTANFIIGGESILCSFFEPTKRDSNGIFANPMRLRTLSPGAPYASFPFQKVTSRMRFDVICFVDLLPMVMLDYSCFRFLCWNDDACLSRWLWRKNGGWIGRTDSQDGMGLHYRCGRCRWLQLATIVVVVVVFVIVKSVKSEWSIGVLILLQSVACSCVEEKFGSRELINDVHSGVSSGLTDVISWIFGGLVERIVRESCLMRFFHQLFFSEVAFTFRRFLGT
jgi:hypothetical protein